MVSDLQRKAYWLHHHARWGYSSIARALGISRQAAYGAVRRAEKKVVEARDLLGWADGLRSKRQAPSTTTLEDTTIAELARARRVSR